MTNLATRDDVEAIAGRELSDSEGRRVEAILEKLSELFRKASGQHFTPNQSHSRLKVNGGEVYLPQRPVKEVLEVTTVHGRTISHHRHGQWLYVPLPSSEMVLVKYEHGSDEVPALVRDTIADAARQVLMINEGAASGVAQVTQAGGPYSANVSYATWAQGGATRLSPADLETARSFRVKHGNVWVP